MPSLFPFDYFLLRLHVKQLWTLELKHGPLAHSDKIYVTSGHIPRVNLFERELTV
jgi:hypothetical protein